MEGAPEASRDRLELLVEDADQLLVPYDRYLELRSAAFPTESLIGPAPVPYALAGATYTARLDGDRHLTLTGQLEIDVYADGLVAVPLTLEGGVLATAFLDGNPAHIGLAKHTVNPARSIAHAQNTNTVTPPLMLQISGKGRHRCRSSYKLTI